jgi:yecA family protein
MLKGTELTPDWLEGYLAAVVVTPEPIRPGEWLGFLFERMPQFRDQEHMQRFLDIVMRRYNAVVRDAADPDCMKRRFAGREPAAAKAWAMGFASAAGRFDIEWKDRTVGKTDKAMLRLVEDTGSGREDPAGLDKLLPEWLVRRYRKRR